jgi:hypothetical protein
MFRALRHALPPRRVGFVVALIAVTGCTLNTDVSGPSTVIRFSGDHQVAPTNTALPSPLSVIVVNQFGQQVKDVTVNWTIVSGGGTLGAAATLTDDSGIASVTYTTGATAGLVTIQARISGIPPLSFTVTVT